MVKTCHENEVKLYKTTMYKNSTESVLDLARISNDKTKQVLFQTSQKVYTLTNISYLKQ